MGDFDRDNKPVEQPKKVLLVDFDGVLNSSEKSDMDVQIEAAAWDEKEQKKLELLSSREQKIEKEKLEREFEKKKQNQVSIRSPQLIHLILKELNAAGVHCILASQRIRFLDITAPTGDDHKALNLANQMQRCIFEAGIADELHWEDAREMVRKIPKIEARGVVDKVEMAKEVLQLEKFRHLKAQDIWLVDDDFQYYKTPMEKANHKFYLLNVSETKGIDYFNALYKWIGLMKELGVPQYRIDRVQLVIDIYKLNYEIEELMKAIPLNIKKAYHLLIDNYSIINQAQSLDDPNFLPDIKKLTDFKNAWENHVSDLTSGINKGIHNIISSAKACLRQNPPNLQAAYRVIKNNETFINDVKKNIASIENPFVKSDVDILFLLEKEIKDAVPSFWKSILVGFSTGFVIGAAAGFAFPGLGNLIGGFVGGFLGVFTGMVTAGIGGAIIGSTVGGLRYAWKNKKNLEDSPKQILNEIALLETSHNEKIIDLVPSVKLLLPKVPTTRVSFPSLVQSMHADTEDVVVASSHVSHEEKKPFNLEEFEKLNQELLDLMKATKEQKDKITDDKKADIENKLKAYHAQWEFFKEETSELYSSQYLLIPQFCEFGFGYLDSSVIPLDESTYRGLLDKSISTLNHVSEIIACEKEIKKRLEQTPKPPV